MRELTQHELDAVSGGGFILHSFNNNFVQVAVNTGRVDQDVSVRWSILHNSSINANANSGNQA